MNHATDGLLQAYHDGEVAGPAAAELRDHLAGCDRCMQELESLRHVSSVFSGALELTDVSVPVSVAPALARPAGARRVSGPGWFGTLSLAKAAALLLMVAGASAAIPGSPVRRAVEAAIARLFPEPQSMAVEPAAAPVPDVRDIRFLPSDGRVRVLVHAPVALDVTVLLTDADYATVERSATGQDVAFRAGPGRVEVSGLQRGSLRIMIPQDAEHASVEIDGKVFAYKQNGVLHLTGPAGTGQGREVSFRFGE